MKKTGMAILVAAMVLVACGGKAAAIKAYGDLFDSATKSIKEISAALKEAKDGKAVASALNKFVDTMMDVKKRGEELDKKYNMKTKGEEMPPELKAKSEEFMKAINDLTRNDMSAVMKFASAPEVKEALKRMQELKG